MIEKIYNGKRNLFLIVVGFLFVVFGVGVVSAVECNTNFSSFYFKYNCDEIKINQSTWLNFDGNDYVYFGQDVPLNFSSGYSFSAWVNLSSIDGTGTNKIILLQNVTTFPYSYLDVRNSSSQPRFSFRIQLNASGCDYSAITSIDNYIVNGKWKHLVGTFINKTLSIYLDGHLEYSNNMLPTCVDLLSIQENYLSKKFYVGSNFNGSIDSVKIYNYSLSYTDVNSLYYDSEYYSPKGFTYVPILYFHDVSNDSAIGWQQGWDPIIPSRFNEFMDYLNSSNFTTITLTQLKNYSLGQINYTKPIVLISDDGYKGIYDYAVPILDKYGFVLNLAIDSQYSENSSIPTFWYWGGADSINTTYSNISYMNWTNLLELQNKGYEIVSHGHNHTRMTLQNLSDRLNVLNNSKYSIYGNLSKMPISFIFPFNSWNSTIMEECNDYYEICSATDGNGLFILNSSSLNNGNFNRKILFGITGGNTTLDEFISYVTYFDLGYNDTSNPLFDFEFNENRGSISYDTLGSGRNGTITGAIWGNDYTTWLRLDNLNNSNEIINFYSLNNALIYNSTKTIINSSTIINNNDGNINITLRIGETIYVLDNFNLTEGANRTYSPLWFSYSSSSVKHIASNLTDTINVTTVISVAENPAYIYYMSDTGAYNYTLTRSNWTYDDTLKIITLNLTGIEPATSSNTLILEYALPPTGGGGSTLDPYANYTLPQNETGNNLNNQTTTEDLLSLDNLPQSFKDLLSWIEDNFIILIIIGIVGFILYELIK